MAPSLKPLPVEADPKAKIERWTLLLTADSRPGAPGAPASTRGMVGSLPPPARAMLPRPRQLDTWLAAEELSPKVAALHAIDPLPAFLQIVMSWALIVGAGILVSSSRAGVLTWLVALVVVGTRQRALLNSLHDASHQHVFGPRWLSRAIASNLLAAPLFEGYVHYRQIHLTHHAFLGDPERDPDHLVLPPELARKGPVRLYFHVFTNPRMWAQSVLGTFSSMPKEPRIRVVVLWTLASTAIGLVCGWQPVGTFMLLWFGARATTFHAIRVFAEISDHVGLPQRADQMRSTRNLPRNLLTSLLHPHGDNYHLTHHLFPGVPLSNLKELHELLLRHPEYAAAIHCESYFVGPGRTVVAGWRPEAQASPGRTRAGATR